MFVEQDQDKAISGIVALGVEKNDAYQIYEQLTPYEVSFDKVNDVVSEYVPDYRVVLGVLEVLIGDDEVAADYIRANKQLIS